MLEQTARVAFWIASFKKLFMYRAYWQFYKSIFPFIAAFSILSLLFIGIVWGVLIFATVGLLIGFLGFNVFYNNNYYFYFNLGISKLELFQTSFIINLFLGIPIFSFFIFIIFFLFGNLQIT